MPTTSDYLEQLEQDREDLVDNLESKGITGLTGDETFTELVPEVLNIPSGSGGLDWTAIGYSEEPEIIEDDYNYSKDIYDNWDSTQTDLSYKFQNDKELVYMPLVNTSNATNMTYIFNNCDNLREVPLLNTSNVTSMRNMFYICSKLENIPLLDTSSLNSNSSFQSFCNGCKNLTDTSLDNILQMCINATLYGGTKTLARLGFNSSDYPTSRIQALTHYQDFIDAGWTIGY